MKNLFLLITLLVSSHSFSSTCVIKEKEHDKSYTFSKEITTVNVNKSKGILISNDGVVDNNYDLSNIEDNSVMEGARGILIGVNENGTLRISTMVKDEGIKYGTFAIISPKKNSRQIVMDFVNNISVDCYL